MKKRGFFLLACAVFFALASCAALADGSMLAQALSQSKWSAFAPKLETESGSVSAGVAMDAALERSVFAIAQRNADGEVSLAACYEALLPADARLSKMQASVSDDQIRLKLSENQTVVFWHAQGGWQINWMYDGVFSLTFENGRLSVYDSSTDFETVVPADAIDLSPEGCSFDAAMQQAARLLREKQQERFALIRAALKEAFPYAEAVAQGEIIAADVLFGDDGASVLAAAAAIDWQNGRSVYFTDASDGAPVNTVCNNLIPNFAGDVAISVPRRATDEYSSHGVSFTTGGGIASETAYSVSMAYSDGALTVTNIDIMDMTTGDFDILTFGADSIERFNALAYGSLYFELPESLRSMQTFDPTVARSAADAAMRSHDEGEAPFIPEAEGEYVIPQPCGAALRSGKWDVYSGPGTQYYREANGKASVSTNDWVQVFGREGEWVLIQYRVSGAKLRFGYVHQSALADLSQAPELKFESVTLEQDNDFVTSDPLGASERIDLSGESWPMTRLAVLGGETWMYVELTLPNGKPARMFAEISASHG